MAEELSAGTGAVAEAKPAPAFAAMKPKVVVPSLKAEDAVAFYKSAFGAEEVKRASYPKRKADQEQPLLICAELKIGGSSFLVCDQNDDLPAVAEAVGGIVICLETEDVSGALAKAVDAGAAAAGEAAGEEEVQLKDPYGVTWIIAKKSCCN